MLTRPSALNGDPAQAWKALQPRSRARANGNRRRNANTCGRLIVVLPIHRLTDQPRVPEAIELRKSLHLEPRTFQKRAELWTFISLTVFDGLVHRRVQRAMGPEPG